MNAIRVVLRTIRQGLCAACLTVVASVAMAQQLPSYYPDSFQRTGRLDAVIPDEQRIVINDTPYRLSDNVVIHAPNAFSVPQSRLRAGLTVAYRTVGKRQIAEIWLLPDGYESRRRGR